MASMVHLGRSSDGVFAQATSDLRHSLNGIAASLNGKSSNGHPTSQNGTLGGKHTQPSDSLDSILNDLDLSEKVALRSGTSFTTTSGLAKHGLYKAKVSDALSDVRGNIIFNGPPAAIFPNATALAATFDKELVQLTGEALAAESKLKAVDVLMAPNLNLHRDPRAGRNNETFGEDPVLAGVIGSAIVKGLHNKGVSATLKHLVCNDSETARRTYDVQVDERTLREIYLRPFEMAVRETNPAAIMTAYNSINGTSAAQHHKLLTDIVRKEWGYEGLVMSDWFGTYDDLKAVKAGLDLEMPFSTNGGQRLKKAVQSNEVSQKELNAGAKRVMSFLKRVNAPEKPIVERATDNSPATRSLLRKIAADAIILLKNEDAKLPLRPKKGSKLAVIGQMATTRTATQLASVSRFVKALEGIDSALKDFGASVSRAPGPAIHRMIPTLDERYTQNVFFRYWNQTQRNDNLRATIEQGSPIASETRTEAREAFVMKQVPGLGADFVIEMDTEVIVPVTGDYTIGLVSASQAEVHIDGEKVFDFVPQGFVDVEHFLFYQQLFEQTFTHRFETGKKYQLKCLSQSQRPQGHGPAPSGLFVGMVETSEDAQRIQESVEMAKEADEVVVFVGTTWEWEMEGVDRQSIKLPAAQDELLKAVIEARKGDVIVVNQSGAAVDLSVANGAKALLHAHWGGQEIGPAIADVLFGRISPSARSPFTWPAQLEDCSSFHNFPHNDQMKIKYEEGLHMGWRGFQKPGSRRPLYPFGHGLSYSTFKVSPAQLRGSVANGKILFVGVTVRNVSPHAGKEVVQVYVRAPEGSQVEHPAKSLEGFAKTHLLECGAQEDTTIELGPRAFSYWDLQTSSWIVEAGKYYIDIATSAEVVHETIEVDVKDCFSWCGMQ